MQTVVDDSFLFGRNALFSHDGFKERQEKVVLGAYDIFTLVVFLERDFKRVKVRVAAFGNIEEFAAERSDKIRVFAFRIHDYYFIVGRKEHIHHFPLCAERLAGAGAAENKSVGVYKTCTVEDNQIVGGLIQSVVNAAFLRQLL